MTSPDPLAEAPDLVESVVRRCFGTMYDAIPDVLFVVAVESDDVFRVVSVNRAFTRLTGVAADEVVERRIEDAMPASAAALRAHYRDALRRGTTVTWIDVSTFPVGRRTGEVSITPVTDQTTGRRFLAGIVKDLTVEEQQAETLLATTRRLEAILERSSDVTSLHDAEGVMRYQSPSVLPILGYTPDELLGRPVLDYIHLDDREATRREIERIRGADGAHPPFETRFRHQDGSWRWFECSGTNLLHDPALRAIVFNAHDITARKAAGDALRRSEAHFRALIEHMSDVVTVLTRDGMIVYESPSLERVLGYTPERMLGRVAWDFVHPDDLASVQAVFGAGQSQQDRPHQFRFRHRDGSWRVLEAVGRAINDEADAPGVIVTSRDVTDRVRADREARELESALHRIDRLLHVVVSGAPVIVFALDPDGVFTLSIGKGLDALGLSKGEVVGRSVFEVYRDYPDLLGHVRRALAGETFVGYADVAGRTYQTWYAMVRDERLGPASVVGVAMDITERRQLEEQLRQAQKLESIGLLAGGVAHDFNNMLTVITGYAELLLTDWPADTPGRHELDEIRKAGEKAAGLAYQLLAFSRKQILQPRSVDVNAIVRDVTRMLQRVIGEHIDLRATLAPDLHRVHADPNQLVQVLLNLAVNARDAMPNGGTLVIATRNVTSPEPDGDVQGPAVELTVSDTGVGMDAATLKRIFEPFFTTKAVGKGTGMGLATVYGIVKQSGGDIAVQSSPGAGTSFRILLPAEATTGSAETVVNTSAPRGSERILLVEDESLVRELTARILSALGYEVTEAADAAAAITASTADPGRFDLLVTDVVLPQMSGRELADMLTRDGTPLKVLFMSGYTDDAILQRGVATESVPFLHKPFTPAELAQAVRTVLDAHAS